MIQYIAVAQNLYEFFLSLKNLFIFSEIEGTSVGRCYVHTSNVIVRMLRSSEASAFDNCKLYFGRRRLKK